MSITFAPPAGASRPREPYVPEPLVWTDNPEADLWHAVDASAQALGGAAVALSRNCEADGYRVPLAHIEAAERAATALLTATAIYRSRRALP